MTTAALRLADLSRTDFRTSSEGDALNTRLLKTLGLDYRYQVARAAIALSLADGRRPPDAGELLGRPIRGETLFGAEEAEIGLWTALIVEHASLDAPVRRDVIDQVAAHWLRGAKLLAQKSDAAANPHLLLADLLTAQDDVART